MVKVAVAGGSDSIGRAIVQAIEKDGEHECFILSRSPKDTDKSKTVIVDYSNIDGLRETLEAHEIDTVISAIALQSDAGGQSQMNLIEAANQSRCTRRFMPSEFGAMYKPEHLEALSLYASKFKAIERLAGTNLEYTQFSNGMFMDYWFAPQIPSAFKFNFPSWIDLDHSYAAIPGDGNAPMVLTHSRDIGRTAQGDHDLPMDKTLNSMFPDIQTLRIQDAVRVYFADKS
ncbi:hypothetical protein CDV36_007636 [Fusarium kuroshium]|uniref:NmrA-like domain-containing protein n=1 Tax=Fusarium kuroshium TaxID=2010991 RepID=A0A3M2S621_9HYPO|nr:hypothetical protein CDV36_007636 [Fusarium kuroshium]